MMAESDITEKIEKLTLSDKESKGEKKVCVICETNERPVPRWVCQVCCQLIHTGIYDPKTFYDCKGSCEAVFRENITRHLYFHETLDGFNPREQLPY